ncbi:MAG: hypothetical protein JOZ37_10210 [Actinobacteria bacterium]|nr:hypothetical protein [Actinomycetota bacterium]
MVVEPSTAAWSADDGAAERATTFCSWTGVGGRVPSPHDSQGRLRPVSPTPGTAQLHTPVGKV